jgi:hypothetical protein
MRHSSTLPFCRLLALVVCMPVAVLAAPLGHPIRAGHQTETTDTEFGSITEVSVPALEELLRTYASTPGRPWHVFQDAAGLLWRDPLPRENTEIYDARYRFSRSGSLLLSGFDAILLPDSSMLDEVRDGNEGESGLTLSGDAEHVHELSVVKFYPSHDHAAVLERQFASATSINRYDVSASAGRDHQSHAVYRIHMNGFAPIYAEVWLDEEGSSHGPGSTTFVFNTSSPEQRIADMRCREG